jgi:hypothetical protein
MAARKKRSPKRPAAKPRALKRPSEGHLFDDLPLRPIPAGERKLSAVLLEFAEPYRAQATTVQAFESLIIVAALAWNKALLRGTKPQAAFDEMLHPFLDSLSAAGRTEIEQLIAVLIRRKNQFFADDHRYVVSFEVSDAGEQYALSVASLPIELTRASEDPL